MGWTYQEANTTEAKERIVRRAYEFETDNVKTTILAMSKVGSAYYLAVHVRPKSDDAKERAGQNPYVLRDDGSYVYAGVCLTGHMRDRFNFGIKELDESSGPYECAPPKKIMALLSPLKPEHDGYARKWRTSCEEGRAAKKAKAAAKVTFGIGDILTFETPLKFKAGDFTQFECVVAGRGARFYALNAEGRPQFMCRMSKHALALPFTVSTRSETFAKAA